MKPEQRKEDADLAAALLFAAGAQVPHRYELEAKAREIAADLNSRPKLLLRAAQLCTPPDTPQRLYLAAKAYSWLGEGYAQQTGQYASEYLFTPGWEALPHRAVKEDGILVDYNAVSRAEVLIDLARAEAAQGRAAAALEDCREAYRLQPYNAMNAVLAAGYIEKLYSRREALDYLREQEKSAYFPPVKYRDAQGNVCYNDTFRQLLQSQIRKLEQGGD